MNEGLIQRMRSWWQHDRIRVSPCEGRLLRVEPGDVVSFRGEDYVISARTIQESTEGIAMQFRCESITKAAVLELQISPQGDVTDCWWIDAAGRQRCDPWELEVWPGRRMV